ncbi:Cytochrome c-type protein SHP [Gammaproteobacteria bacterium]
MRNILFSTLLMATPALAVTPQEILKSYDQNASAARGEQLFLARHARDSGKPLGCFSCHGDDPRSQGRNEKTGKSLQPLAPVANPERLTNTFDVEKWFKRNCQDVLARPCTPQEKADVVAWLISLR